MNTLVVYTSKTGFTKQYAEQIAARLHCEAVSAKAADAQALAAADTVVYGGWIFAGKVSGLAKIRPLVKGKLVVFAVGATPVAQIDVNAIAQSNDLGETPVFYLEGGFRFEKLGFMTRFMLKTVSGMAAKKENPTEQDRMMAGLNGASFDHTDMNAIEPLIASL